MGFDTQEYEKLQTQQLQNLLEDFDRKALADELYPTIAPAPTSEKVDSTTAVAERRGGTSRPQRIMPDRQVNRPVEEQVAEWTNAFPHLGILGRRVDSGPEGVDSGPEGVDSLPQQTQRSSAPARYAGHLLDSPPIAAVFWRSSVPHPRAWQPRSGELFAGSRRRGGGGGGRRC